MKRRKLVNQNILKKLLDRVDKNWIKLCLNRLNSTNPIGVCLFVDVPNKVVIKFQVFLTYLPTCGEQNAVTLDISVDDSLRMQESQSF